VFDDGSDACLVLPTEVHGHLSHALESFIAFEGFLQGPHPGGQVVQTLVRIPAEDLEDGNLPVGSIHPLLAKDVEQGLENVDGILRGVRGLPYQHSLASLL